MKLVSIIVLNWNGRHLLEECLEAVDKQTYPEVEVIVIDNGSADGSVSFLKDNFGDIKIVENERNIGFAPAMNIGFNIAKGDYLLPLNNDVTLEPNFVEEMIKAVKEQNVGMVSGKLIKAGTIDTQVLDSTGHIFFKNRLPRNRGAGEHISRYSESDYVFGACGAAPLYKREMLDDVVIDGEYYDESFFSFLEDVDLDWRAQLRGWKCRYAPAAIAYHWRGGTAVRRSTIVEKHNYKNRYLMLLKNDSIPYLLLNLPQILVTDVIKSGALLFRAPSALLGWLSIIRLFPKTLKKRRYIQQRRKISGKEIEQMLKKFDYKSWIKHHLKEDVYDLTK